MDNQISKEKIVLATLLTLKYADLIYAYYGLILLVPMKGEKENKLLGVLKNGFKAIDPHSFNEREGISEIMRFLVKVGENYQDKEFIEELGNISQTQKDLYNSFLTNLVFLRDVSKPKDQYEKTMADMWEYELDIYYKDNSPLKAVTNY